MNAAQGAVEVKAPIQSVYRHWLRVEGLPKFIAELQNVRRLDRDHYAILLAYDGKRWQGVLEIMLRVPERRVAWRITREGSPCDHLIAGVVSFSALSDQSTCVTLKVSTNLGGTASHYLDSYLQNFRRLMENPHNSKGRDDAE